MKRIVTILIILAILLSCLTSCSEKIPTNVSDEWHALINGECNVSAIVNSLGITAVSSTLPITYENPETIKNAIAYLKDFNSHIVEEIKVDDTSSKEYDDEWINSYGGVLLYVNMENKDTTTEKTAGISIEVKCNYIVVIEFTKDICRVTIADKDLEIKAYTHFKCDDDTLKYVYEFKKAFSNSYAQIIDE